MKKIIYSLSALMIAMIFMACPYKSDVPIDAEAKMNVNNSLLGNYEKKGSTSYIYSIKKESEKEYKIIKTSTSETSTAKPTVYYGYLSKVDGETYLQTYKKSKYSSKKSYYLYKIIMNKSATILTMKPVTENIREKFTTSKELKNFIIKHQHLSFFFEKDEKYYKSE